MKMCVKLFFKIADKVKF